MTEPETSRGSLRRALPVIVAVAAFLVPAGAGITIGLISASTSSAAPAATHASVEAATQSPTPVAVEPYDFSSQSGNLRCHIDSRSAWCHQGEYTYFPPEDNCAVGGVAVGVTTTAAYWPCVPARPELSPSIAYDTPVVRGDFTCLINLTTGARCTNSVGAGFTIEYATGATTF